MREETKKQLNSILVKDKTKKILIVVCVALFCILLFYSGCEKDKTDNTQALRSDDTESYRNSLSEEILKMVESISGTGKAKVLLTLDTSYEYIYLDDDETLRKVNEPKIRGVVVTCEGGNSAKVRQEITELLTTALGVPSTKVCVKKLS